MTAAGTTGACADRGACAVGGRAVVTGLGVVAPTGLGTGAYWAATVEGRSALAALNRFDTAPYSVRVAGEVPGFVAAEHVSGRLLPQTDHNTRLSLTAAAFALADSGLDSTAAGEYGIGTATAASMGGFEFGQRELQNLWGRGPDYVSAYQSFAWFYAVNTGQLSIRHDLRGPGTTLVTDHAGALDALGHARRQVRNGTGVMVTGGVDGALCPLGWAGHLSTAALTPVADPAAAYLPFAAAASGHVPGEGGAILVLEDEHGARARDARILGEVAGYAATFDPDPADPAPSGLARAVRAALADARCAPGEVDLVLADAAGRVGPDRQEAAALAEIFGAHAVPVTAPKAGTGRLGAGGAAVDVAAALLSIRDGVVPPTPNVTAPIPDLPIDLVLDTARVQRVRCAVVAARGVGGFNAAVVLRACP